MTVEEISRPARIAEPGEAISVEELALAARNHGMPLEALRYDLTPPGLHYVLVHYDIPMIEAATWRLRIGGLVAHDLELDLASLAAFQPHTVRVTMECAGNGRALLQPRPISQPWLVEAVGTAEWTGVRLAELLRQAGADPQATEVVFTGADHGFERGVEQDYQRSPPLTAAQRDEVLVAYAMNGAPLPPQHGYPVRLIVPGWYGMAHVKWLVGVEVVGEPFAGFQNAVAYRYRQRSEDAGEPVTRIGPRALLVPPGVPDFMSRARIVRPGLVGIEGRAWCGRSPIARVDFSADGGETWADAELEPRIEHPWAWRRWRHSWQAIPGSYRLVARAITVDGEEQPVDPPWNRGGFGNNAAQVVPVTCLG